MREHYSKTFSVNEFPMFILGDREGSTCDDDIAHLFQTELERGLALLPAAMQERLMGRIGGGVVQRNFQFAGVHNVDFWSGLEKVDIEKDGKIIQIDQMTGRVKHGVNALQVECNEAAYVNEDGKYDHERIAVVHLLITQAAMAVDRYLKTQ